MVLLEATLWVVTAAWFLLVSLPARRWPSEMLLRAGDRRVGEVTAKPRPAVVALVPARDEADVLPASLPTLLEQNLQLEAVVLVDDGSSDGTAETARRIAEKRGAGDRLVVCSAPPTPPGWTGKLHALAVGWREIGERWGDEVEWVLVTDADIAHREDSVAALVRVGSEGGYGLVSVMARLRADSFWERLLVPPFVYFFHLLYPFRLVASARSRVAAAAGGCLLVSRRALDRAGGFAAIRSELIDDVALGRRLQESGSRIWLGFDAGIRSLRRYGTLGSLWEMVARSAFVQLRYRWDLLVLVEAGLLTGLVAPAVLALAGGFALVSGFSLSAALWRTAILGAGTWALQVVSILPFERHHRVPSAYAATLPVAAALFGAMTVSSALRHARRRGVRWKGRAYGPAASRKATAEAEVELSSAEDE